MASFNCIATLPTPPDPAVTPLTKQPVKQFFSASVNGVEVVPETELDLTVTTAPMFVVPEDAEVSLLCSYVDASNLRSGFKTQTVKAPSAPDTTPPDAPGDFGEIKFEAVADAVQTSVEAPAPAAEPVAEAPAEPAAEPAPAVAATPAEPAATEAAPTETPAAS